MTAVLPPLASTTLHDGSIDSSPPPRRDLEPMRLGAARALLAVPLACVWIVLYLAVLSDFEQGHTQHSLYDRLRTELALGEAPAGAPIPVGDPVAVISAPAIGLDNVVIVEGSGNAELQAGPGHVTGTVLPGQQGWSSVAGKSFSFGAPFGRLRELKPGMRFSVTTGQGRFAYEVTRLRIEGDPVPTTVEPGKGRLTLVTSLRSGGALGGLRPSRTLYVDAETASAAAAGRVGLKDPDTNYMSGRLTVSTLAQLALALQLLIVVLIGFAWAWQSWSRRSTWIVGLPTVLATLWAASSLATAALPGLL